MAPSYYIANPGSTPRGPFPLESIRDMYRSGLLSRDCLIYTQGMADWQPIETVLIAPQPPKAWGPFVAWKTCVFHRLLKFSGRASRAEYWYFALGNLLIFLLLLAFIFGVAIVGNGNGISTGSNSAFIPGFLAITLLALFYILSALAGLSASVRRLHDTGKSGFWILTSFIPFIGIFFTLVLFFFYISPGDGPNAYGPGPDDPAA